mmetsp:Transcript_96129/g.140482  ORF Transcript_96129/g.140482 Transcript_96129/m.140482 type:complete len:283 (+) Transcript_96129:106-954(+)
MSRCTCSTMWPCARAFLIASRLPSTSTMPPPQEMTVPTERTLMVCAKRAASMSRNLGQPLAVTKSMMGILRSATATSSMSTKSRPMRRARSLPIVVLPAPRMPIRMQCWLLGAKGSSSGCESALESVAPRCRRRWSQYSGYVFSTHSFSVMMRPGSRQPSTPNDMAMRWSSWHWMMAPRSLLTPPAPSISIPSSSSRHVTPHLVSSTCITWMRLHSFTRWLATPRMRVVPLATAASTAAVIKASVMVSMSKSPRPLSVPAAGPCTVVCEALCSIVQPILASK